MELENHGLERDASFLNEVWGLYAFGMFILFVRFAVRIKSVGFRGFQLDDFFAFIVVITYTCDAATVHLVYLLGSNVEAAVFQQHRTLTEEEVRQYTLGSKLQLVAWYTYTALLWSLKGTMLSFFKRITTGLWQARLVRWLNWACIVSYAAVVLTLTFGCFPTAKNWQVVPDPGSKCTFKMQNFLVTVVLNVLTDAALLCIPLPLLWTLQVPVKKKLVIGVLICSGFFVIAAAIIRVVLTLDASPSGTNINRWGVRETIVGIIAVNIPILRPMFTKAFWTRTGTLPSSYMGGKSTTARSRALELGQGPYEMTASVDQRSVQNTGSEEFIVYKTGSDLEQGQGIHVQTDYQVRSEEATQDRGVKGWDTTGTTSKVDTGNRKGYP